MNDYSTFNYCDFLWISDLLELRRDNKNEFVFEIQNGEESKKCTIFKVIIFGTIVEVKEVGYKGVLYQVDDGTGVITCKRTEEQFEEILRLIEQEQVAIPSEGEDVQLSFEQSLMTDTSTDDSIFNDRSTQIEDINLNRKNRLRDLQSIWDDIYKSFTCLIEPYNVGDCVLIEGKLYNYFNVNQIYVNSMRAIDLEEEIMYLSIKLEDGYEQKKGVGSTKIEAGSEKRMSGLVTFDNIPNPQHKITVPAIVMPEWKDDMLSPGIVTPNLNAIITFDTFTRRMYYSLHHHSFFFFFPTAKRIGKKITRNHNDQWSIPPLIIPSLTKGGVHSPETLQHRLGLSNDNRDSPPDSSLHNSSGYSQINNEYKNLT